MSSTDFVTPRPEKNKIFEICRKVHDAGETNEVLSTPSPEKESYYCDRSELKLFESEITDYAYSTPVELRTMLQKMWEYQQCHAMMEFTVVSTIATFQFKLEESKPVQQGISAFIYNF